MSTEPEDAFHPRPTLLENAAMWLCEAAILAMGGVVILEIATRNLLGFSFEISEEIGGYVVAGITFASLPACQVYRSYHHVQFLQDRLSARMRALSHVAFDLLSLAFCLLLVWQLGRFAAASYRAEDTAPTLLGTPLWIPQAAMPLGALAASVSLARSVLGNWRRFRAGRA